MTKVIGYMYITHFTVLFFITHKKIGLIFLNYLLTKTKIIRPFTPQKKNTA